LIENFDFNFLSIFFNCCYLQTNGSGLLGIFGININQFVNEEPIIKGMIPTLFLVSGFGISINFFNSIIRKKVVDQRKMKFLMEETKEWKNQKINAVKSKDHEKLLELNKKSSYINKISLEIMQMNMRPMIFTIIPVILVFYFILPQLFANIVALSPISLNVFPGNFFHLTCTAEQVADPNNFCTQENSVYRWSWYFLSSIAFSGIIMKITKTSIGLK